MIRARAHLVATASVLLALVASSCSSTGGPTEDFELSAPHTVFVLAPRPDLISGREAEVVRRAFMKQLRRKGYGVSSSADAMLIPVVERWGNRVGFTGSSPAQVRISARLIDRQDRLLWEDRAGATESVEEEDEDGDLLDSLLDAGFDRITRSVGTDWSDEREQLARRAVQSVLRSLPDAPQR